MGGIRADKAGFTIIEIVVVVAIVSILLLAANPGGNRSREPQIGKKGEMDLISIYNAEKSYKLDNTAYTTNLADLTSTVSTAAFSSISVNAMNFTYVITLPGTGFKVTGTRTGSGICKGKTISINSAGLVCTVKGPGCLSDGCSYAGINIWR